MARKILTNAKKAPMEIARLISNNKRIIKLLYDDSKFALSPVQKGEQFPDFSKLIQDQYICFCSPNIINVENLKRNTFITILLEDFNFSSDQSTVKVEGAIHVTTNESHFALDGGENRALEIVDEIFTTINGEKLSATGALNIDSVTFTGYSKDYFNYRVSFSFMDELSRGVDF